MSKFFPQLPDFWSFWANNVEFLSVFEKIKAKMKKIIQSPQKIYIFMENTTVPAPINGAPTIQKIIFREEVRQLKESALKSKNNF